ncbi:hypothetical protein AKO1_006845 [Acrasis kona]|uniref:MRN complex-interacting protein N-terminal domain-containing protein n=1 Tax=Acrasis kona TaxID=1008807 RepID=A0AAW2YSW1_9EUKA
MGKIEYIAVQCFECRAFQVAQQTKTNKWQCKICNSKQTVRKIYAISYQAKDIRPIIQDLNLKRGELEKQKPNHELNYEFDDDHTDQDTFYGNETVQEPVKSKWAKFQTNEPQDEQEEQDDYGVITTTVVPDKKRAPRKQKQEATRSKRKYANDNDDDDEQEFTPPKRRKIASKRIEEDYDEPYEEQTSPRMQPAPTRAQMLPASQPEKKILAPPSKDTSSWNKLAHLNKSNNVTNTNSKWGKFLNNYSTNHVQDDDQGDDNIITDPDEFYGRDVVYE